MSLEQRSGLFGSYWGDTKTSSHSLTQEQMSVNAVYIYSYLSYNGWTTQSISAMLGNMQSESSINPGRWEGDDVGTGPGYGLVQWTPYTKYTEWATNEGYDYSTMDSNLARILYEVENGIQWIPTSSYPMSFSEFKSSTQDPYTLAMAFLYNYERPASLDQPNRGTQAEAWYEYLEGGSQITYIPRLTSDGMSGSKYWYSTGNPYYPEYGLPNCTCFAFGRFWEISDQYGHDVIPSLSHRNAEYWYGNTNDGYERGSTPKLGAVACWRDGEVGGEDDGAGHVAIVEEIDSEGNITCSNSAYGGDYFFITHRYASNGYNNGSLIFQGFIYNPYVTSSGPIPPHPPTPVYQRKKTGYKFVLFERRRRASGKQRQVFRND